MRWSFGSTALLLALAAGTNAMAAEPADPAFGAQVARPGIWSSRLANGFLGGNHVRPASMGHGLGGHGGGEIIAGEGYDAAAVEGGYVYGPGSCDYQPPCVDHLWDGYVKRPHRCHLGHGHRHGCGRGLCGGGWSYNGLGAGCGGCGCGFKLKSWFGNGCDDCADECGAASACDSGSCGGGLGLCKHHGRSACEACDCGGHGHRFKHGGLGRFWAACFGDDCGCNDAIDGCGCSAGAGQDAAIVPGPVGPAKPIDSALTPSPAEAPQGVKGSLKLNELPLPPAPMPEPEEAQEKEPAEAKEATKEAAYRSFPSYRGFGSFGL